MRSYSFPTAGAIFDIETNLPGTYGAGAKECFNIPPTILTYSGISIDINVGALGT